MSHRATTHSIALTAIALGLLLALASCGKADDAAAPIDVTPDSGSATVPTPAAPPSPVLAEGDALPIPASDQAFLVKAAASDLHELAAAALAAKRANSRAVKDYAAMLAAHHRRSHDELKAMAALKNVALPAAEADEALAATQRLAGLSGAAFDEAFALGPGVAAHEAAVQLYSDGAASTADPQLQAHVARTLPLLREHLAAARQLPR